MTLTERVTTFLGTDAEKVSEFIELPDPQSEDGTVVANMPHHLGPGSQRSTLQVSQVHYVFRVEGEVVRSATETEARAALENLPSSKRMQHIAGE